MDEVQRQQALSAIRTLLAVGAGFMVGHGYVNEATATEIVGAVMALIPFAWGYWNKKTSEQKTQARVTEAYNAGVSQLPPQTTGAKP